MKMRRSGAGFLASITCLILFIYIFMHEDDPFFAYDNITMNIASFSQLTSSVAKGFRWLLNSTQTIQRWLVNITDSLFTSGPDVLLDALWNILNPLNWFAAISPVVPN